MIIFYPPLLPISNYPLRHHHHQEMLLLYHYQYLNLDPHYHHLFHQINHYHLNLLNFVLS